MTRPDVIRHPQIGLLLPGCPGKPSTSSSGPHLKRSGLPKLLQTPKVADASRIQSRQQPGSARLICTTTNGYILTLHGIPLTHHARPQNSRVNVMALGVSLAKARRQAGDGTSAGCSVALASDDAYYSKVSTNLRTRNPLLG